MINRNRRLIAGFAFVASSIVIAMLVTFVGEPPSDLRIVREAAAWRDGAIGRVMETVSDYGYGMWLVPLSLAIALALSTRPHRRRDATIVALSTTLAVIVTRVMKETFDRARPDGAHELVSGFSMPSGHATSAAAFGTSMILAAHGTRAALPVTVAAITFAVLVGTSRVVLGVHYPTDVIAGYCSGIGVTLLVAEVVDRVRIGRPGGVTEDQA